MTMTEERGAQIVTTRTIRFADGARLEIPDEMTDDEIAHLIEDHETPVDGQYRRVDETGRKNHIRIGVRAWSKDGPASETGKWTGSLNCLWVEVDGTRVPGAIIDARTTIGAGFHSATIEVCAGKIETVPVDADGNEIPDV